MSGLRRPVRSEMDPAKTRKMLAVLSATPSIRPTAVTGGSENCGEEDRQDWHDHLRADVCEKAHQPSREHVARESHKPLVDVVVRSKDPTRCRATTGIASHDAVISRRFQEQRQPLSRRGGTPVDFVKIVASTHNVRRVVRVPCTAVSSARHQRSLAGPPGSHLRVCAPAAALARRMPPAWHVPALGARRLRVHPARRRGHARGCGRASTPNARTRPSIKDRVTRCQVATGPSQALEGILRAPRREGGTVR